MSAYSHNKEDMSLKDNQFVKSEEGKWVLQHRRQWHELICVFLIFIPIGMLVVYTANTIGSMDPTDTEAVVPSRKWGICLLVGGFAVQLVPFLLSRRIFARRKLRRLQAVEERVFATFSCFNGTAKRFWGISSLGANVLAVLIFIILFVTFLGLVFLPS